MKFFSYPKLNICFKIIGLLENNYCEILSRFVRVKGDIFDTLEFKDSKRFEILGLNIENNSIARAKDELSRELARLNHPRAKYLEHFKIIVDKKIPLGAGLGGGSSNAATYLLAMNEILELNLNIEVLSRIAQKIGADVVFFVHNIDSANVSGFGEIIESYEEILPSFKIITPKISCETPKVYCEFKKCAKFSDKTWSENLLKLDSKEILKNHAFSELNDLFPSALFLYPKLSDFKKEGYFFSGSGSSFFALKGE